MNSTGDQKELIRQIKQARLRSGISYQRIVDRVADSGGSVSLSTVRKVFRPGSEGFHYRAEDTLWPIARVLLPPGSVPEDGATVSLSSQQTEAAGDAAGTSDADALSQLQEKLLRQHRRTTRTLHLLSVFLCLSFLLLMLSLSLRICTAEPPFPRPESEPTVCLLTTEAPEANRTRCL